MGAVVFWKVFRVMEDMKVISGYRMLPDVDAFVSIAISLKRIADALDDGSSVTLLDTLRGIEMNGRQN